MWKGKVKISNQVGSFFLSCISKHLLETYIIYLKKKKVVFNFCQVKEGCWCGRLPLKDNHWNFSTLRESAQNAHKLSSSRCVEDQMQELKSKSRVVKLAVLAKKLDENIMLKYKLLYSDLSLSKIFVAIYFRIQNFSRWKYDIWWRK